MPEYKCPWCGEKLEVKNNIGKCKKHGIIFNKNPEEWKKGKKNVYE